MSPLPYFVSVSGASPILRRTLLTGFVGAALSGCAVSGRPASQSSARPTPPESPGSTRKSPDNTPATSPTDSPTGTPTQVPGRAEIVARFGHLRPTQWSNGESFRGPISGVVQRTLSDKVVLTLDACGGPYGSHIDQRILDLLHRLQIPAVLFLNKRWVEANPATFDKMASSQDLFDIGNHGTNHRPLSVTGRKAYAEQGTANAGEVYDEVMANHHFLEKKLGKAPVFYRSGTAYYDDVATLIVRALGEIPIGFDINGDAGTTYSAHETAVETAKAGRGSIIICHMNQPSRPVFEGLSVALPKLRARGLKFAKLSTLPLA